MPIRHSYQWPRPENKKSRHKCPLSDLIQPHKLSRRRDDDGDDPPLFVCYACKGKHLEGRRYYYYCATCNLEFHRGCHVMPLEMNHPLHPFHPLTLTSLDPDFDSFKIPHEWKESSSDSEVYHYDHISDDDQGQYAPDAYDGDGNFGDSENCKCCLHILQDKYYHCSICNFSLSFACAINPPPLNISHLKSHHHTLTLLPRRIPLPCDACGRSLANVFDLVYACLPCNYMVHRTCIYLPRVIKITRHQHRISLISSRASGDYSCGVCHQTIDVSYGHYSCNRGCDFVVHSKCATLKDVWDGKDLEEVYEEPEEIEPFTRIDEETIQHFTHDHYLKLQGKDSIRGGKRFCDACCFLISNDDDFYSCMQCKYVLHEACACLPRIKHHPLHKHPLILHQSLSYPDWFGVSSEINNMFSCDGCERRSSGFVYQCHEKGCIFLLDVRCASVTDKLIHGSHPDADHSFFIDLGGGYCIGSCFSLGSQRRYLKCIKCWTHLCFTCATLPSVAHYKHDSHPLTLCYGEEEEEEGTTSGQYWCELCESKIDATRWFYTCDSCRVTLHVTCLLGSEIHLKPQHITTDGIEFEITCNVGNTRPKCYECSRRCGEPLVFKWEDEYFCDWECIAQVLY